MDDLKVTVFPDNPLRQAGFLHFLGFYDDRYKMPRRNELYDLVSLGNSRQHIALVGAGPSLQLCIADLQSLANARVQILLADSIARGLKNFIRWGNPPPVVFSVEKRRHLYLHNLPADWKIAMYWQSSLLNLPVGRPAWLFSFVGESAPYLPLVSPGTVLGAALAYALYCLKIYGGGQLYLLGVDFSYLDHQVYSPAIYPHLPLANRFNYYERGELLRVYQKTAGFLQQQGYLLRTSAELAASRENWIRLLNTVTFNLEVINYSPVLLPAKGVRQQMPSALH